MKNNLDFFCLVGCDLSVNLSVIICEEMSLDKKYQLDNNTLETEIKL